MSDRWPRWWRAWTWRGITLRAHRWLHDQIIGDDPDPQYSRLDNLDGLK